MDKFSEERKILELTKPLLVELYGHFNIVPEQADRPDAAIVLDATGGKIGIEITSVDGQEIQQYFNDEKFGKDFKLEQVGELIASGRHSNRPDKKASISFPNSYIVSGILKKSKKYSDYLVSGEYEEVILIAFSEILEIRSKYFDSYHKPWTWHLLSKESFPFSKVIFVCKQHGDSALVFDKNIQSPQPPERDYEKELGVTRISGPILPLEEGVKLYEMFDNKPLIRPPQKSKLKNKKRKAQKNARKINRKN